MAKKAEQQMKGHVVAIYKELKLKHIAYEAAQVPITPIMSALQQRTNCLPCLLLSHQNVPHSCHHHCHMRHNNGRSVLIALKLIRSGKCTAARILGAVDLCCCLHCCCTTMQANLLRLEAENAQLQADLQTQRFNIDKHQKVSIVIMQQRCR